MNKLINTDSYTKVIKITNRFIGLLDDKYHKSLLWENGAIAGESTPIAIVLIYGIHIFQLMLTNLSDSWEKWLWN